MIRAAFVDDSIEYLQCIQEYMGGFFKEKDIEFKTYLLENKNDDKRIEEKILKEQPQFVFCDMAMPFCDGGELIKRITEKYRPITVLISSVENIHIHKYEFDYLLRKQPDLRVLQDAISLIIKSFEFKEEISIDQILATEFTNLTYNERRYLRKIIRKFKDVEDPKQIKVTDISKATNTEIHTTIHKINKFIEKIFKKKINRDLFISELLKIYKRGRLK